MQGGQFFRAPPKGDKGGFPGSSCPFQESRAPVGPPVIPTLFIACSTATITPAMCPFILCANDRAPASERASARCCLGSTFTQGL